MSSVYTLFLRNCQVTGSQYLGALFAAWQPKSNMLSRKLTVTFKTKISQLSALKVCVNPQSEETLLILN